MHNLIFDSHSHYDDDAFDSDRETFLPHLLNTVKAVLHASVDTKSMDFGIENSERFRNFYTSVGFHPEAMDRLPENPCQYLEDVICQKKGKIVAVGEIGLDYHYEGYDRDAQIKLFDEQLELAKKYDLPVIVHLRDATEDGLSLIRKHRPRGVMHCFSGSAETAKEVVSLGMYVSFTGVLTFKNSKKAKKACAEVPVDRLLLETDCPYMAPEPFRGRRCDSTMILQTAESMAQIKGISTEEMLNIASKNTCDLFGISI
ncbi:MAG: TatD family deoxyribonuclease [Ruminococcus sp.]|nr:TatD family deoxyribonuclease [Ruminococcus sp.]